MHEVGKNKELQDFGSQYIQLRHWEGRVYTDEQLRELPKIETHHPHFKEWQFRDESSSRLCNYLKKKERPIKILEIGCGNGWLAARLATFTNSQVLGIDINEKEIEQARSVFSQVNNLELRLLAPADLLRTNEQFDVIVFAASFQYFPFPDEILGVCMEILNEEGEIHIIDSHFYPISELASARKRSELYFEAVGFPELSKYYFHHTLDDIDDYEYQVLYDPNSLFNRFIRNKNPFHWIRILK